MVALFVFYVCCRVRQYAIQLPLFVVPVPIFFSCYAVNEMQLPGNKLSTESGAAPPPPSSIAAICGLSARTLNDAGKQPSVVDCSNAPNTVS